MYLVKVILWSLHLHKALQTELNLLYGATAEGFVLPTNKEFCTTCYYLLIVHNVKIHIIHTLNICEMVCIFLVDPGMF